MTETTSGEQPDPRVRLIVNVGPYVEAMARAGAAGSRDSDG